MRGQLLCRRCASRMHGALDRDCLWCELCGHEVSGLELARLRARRWRWWLRFRVLGV